MTGCFLQNGLSVLIDSACFYLEIIKFGQRLDHQYDAEYRYIECKIDNISILENWLQQRMSHRSWRMGINKLRPDAGVNVVGGSVVGDPGALFTQEPAQFKTASSWTLQARKRHAR